MTNALKSQSAAMLPALEQEMRAVLGADNGSEPDLFHGMIYYHMGWVNAELQPINVHGGKRIRPLLCLLTGRAAGGDWQQALPAAAAIELLHNFSLIHDDIEDASDTRRGRRTLWKIWGMEQGINSGDALFAMSHLALNRLIERGVPARIVVQALRRFDEVCVRLTQGQHADMRFESCKSVTVDEYIQMIEGKTAALLSLSTELGALVAGCDADTVDLYARFGRNLGLAFQVIDDILGIWGDEALTGKSAATDILTRKKTLPVLYGLARSEPLRALYALPEISDSADYVSRVIQLLDEHGAYDFARQRAAAYSDESLDNLEAARPAGDAGIALRQLAALVLERDY